MQPVSDVCNRRHSLSTGVGDLVTRDTAPTVIVGSSVIRAIALTLAVIGLCCCLCLCLVFFSFFFSKRMGLIRPRIRLEVVERGSRGPIGRI